MNRLEKLLVTYPELRLIGIRFSREYLTKLMQQGKFPKPLRPPGLNAVSTRSHWRLADILSWIDEQSAAAGLPPIAPPACLVSRDDARV